MIAHDPISADAASEADRAWFSGNPLRTVRIRTFLPGELPMAGRLAGDGVQCCIVRQVRPGMRVRLPVYLPRLPADTEASAMYVLRQVLGLAA